PWRVSSDSEGGRQSPMAMSFFFARGGGAYASRVKVYRISRSPEAPLARIVPDTIDLRYHGSFRIRFSVKQPVAVMAIFAFAPAVILDDASFIDFDRIDLEPLGPAALAAALKETSTECVFRAKVPTDSGRNLPPIPAEGCH